MRDVNRTVSVVIPAYNPRHEWLDQAIRSALDQKPVPIEVIVVDDGSPVPVCYEHPLVRVLRQENAGVAAARNAGIAAARGDLVATLDADDYWLPGKLAAQLAALGDDAVLSVTGSLIRLGGQMARPWGYGSTLPCSFEDVLEFNGVTTSTALFDRAAALRVGGFPRQTHAEDWAFWLALTRVGRLTPVSEPYAVYRRHEANVSRDPVAMWCGQMRTHVRYPGVRSAVGMAKKTKHLLAVQSRGVTFTMLILRCLRVLPIKR